jgi:hypothetical protein
VHFAGWINIKYCIQLAHIVDETTQTHNPNDLGEMDNNTWAVHASFFTTTNFAPKGIGL